MKKVLLIIMLILSFYNCKAQSPVLNMEADDVTKINMPDNGYYKDVNNVLNDFEGTWLYTNGNTSLKIVLVKNTMYFNGKFYEDIIVGGYQYIENGVEKINTLSDADNPSIGRNASIKGNNIYDDCSYIPVDDCIEGEKRLDLSIEDTITTEHFGDFILHKRTVNGQEALKAMISMNYHGEEPSEGGTYPDPTMPWQMRNIVLIRQ